MTTKKKANIISQYAVPHYGNRQEKMSDRYKIWLYYLLYIIPESLWCFKFPPRPCGACTWLYPRCCKVLCLVWRCDWWCPLWTCVGGFILMSPVYVLGVVSVVKWSGHLIRSILFLLRLFSAFLAIFNNLFHPLVYPRPVAAVPGSCFTSLNPHVGCVNALQSVIAHGRGND